MGRCMLILFRHLIVYVIIVLEAEKAISPGSEQRRFEFMDRCYEEVYLSSILPEQNSDFAIRMQLRPCYTIHNSAKGGLT